MTEMRTMWMLAGLSLCAGTVAQEPAAPVRPPAAAEAKKSAEQLVADLGSESYKTRLQAERALRAMGKDALPALKKAAEDDGDVEAQWRARRLVRQIEKGTSGGLAETKKDDGPEPQIDDGSQPWRMRRLAPFHLQQGLPESMREQFESLFERFEQDFGLDVPRARFFHDDFFRDLQEQMQQMKAGAGSAHGMRVEIGPDGVRVEVEEKNEKGETEKKVYEAKDLESFHEQFPGVLQRGGLGFQFGRSPRGLLDFQVPHARGWVLDPDRDHTFQPFQFQPSWPGTGQDDVQVEVAPPPAGKRLGVTVRPIPAELREHLELGEDRGLMVETVQPDSLAQSLGLQRGDIVVQIGDAPIGSAADVQKALGAVDAGKQVDVKFVRKGVEKTASATKTEAVEPPKKLEAKKRGESTIR